MKAVEHIKSEFSFFVLNIRQMLVNKILVLVAEISTLFI